MDIEAQESSSLSTVSAITVVISAYALVFAYLALVVLAYFYQDGGWSMALLVAVGLPLGAGFLVAAVHDLAEDWKAFGSVALFVASLWGLWKLYALWITS